NGKAKRGSRRVGAGKGNIWEDIPARRQRAPRQVVLVEFLRFGFLVGHHDLDRQAGPPDGSLHRDDGSRWHLPQESAGALRNQRPQGMLAGRPYLLARTEDPGTRRNPELDVGVRWPERDRGLRKYGRHQGAPAWRDAGLTMGRKAISFPADIR